MRLKFSRPFSPSISTTYPGPVGCVPQPATVNAATSSPMVMKEKRLMSISSQVDDDSSAC
jgi:hypothetical protein